MYSMRIIAITLITVYSSGVYSRLETHQENGASPRSILSKFLHRRDPRELNIIGRQAVLKLADLSGNIPNPCNNGGTLLHDVKRNTYICQCSSEYEGRNCEMRTRICLENYNACGFYKNSSVTHECRPVQGNGFICYYHPPQYQRNWCQTENVESDQRVCPESWSCIDHILGENQGYRCLPPGHIIPPIPRGKRHVESIQKCSCRNGGHCDEDNTCICLLHFTGPYCESHVNYCNSNPCPSNVDCQPVVGGYNCVCPEFRGGHNCEETRRFLTPVMVDPRFNYHANQYVSVLSTYLFYAKYIGTLPRLTLDFGDGTMVEMFEQDFHSIDKINDILISFLYEPVDYKGVVYLVNCTHTYNTEGLYNISLAVWNAQQVTMRNSFTVLVSSSKSCGFSIELINAATTPHSATIYQRRHSINVHSISTVSCPEIRLKYLWELFAVPNIFAAHTPEMMRRSSPDVLIRIAEYHMPPYSLSFGNYVLRLTVGMLEPAQGENESVITWFKIVKDEIVTHISGGNKRQVHESESFEIDASESYDPNFPSDTLRYEWKCFADRLEDVIPRFCNNESISDQSILKVPRNILKLNGVYTFTVNVESIEHDRSAQSVAIQVVPKDTETVHIECVQNCLGNKVITNSPMALRAVSLNHTESINYIWSLRSNALILADVGIGYYSDGNNFVTKSGILLPAQTYQISVRVENKNDAAKQIGRATIDLVTYPALTIGFCTVFPSQGYALLTVFNVKCFHFIVNYFPVIYEIFQYRLPKEEPIMIGFGVSPEFFNLTLAAGLPENDFSTALRVYASDSKGNFGFYEWDVTVFPAALYTNFDDELALVKKMTLGTGSALVTDLANQEVQSVIRTVLSASCSVHTLSQQLRDSTQFRKSGTVTRDAKVQEQIYTIAQFKDTMVEYLSLCELRSPTIAKYCSSTLTSILQCDNQEDIAANRKILPYANRKAVTVLNNIVGMLHKTTQKSEDTTAIRTDVLDIGTTILSSISLLLKRPTGTFLNHRRMQRYSESNEIPVYLVEQEEQLAQQTEVIIDSMNNYASLFARYMAPHEDDYLTNPTEDICISVQKTNRGVKTATLPAYVEVNVSILSNDSNAIYNLQVIGLKNNPYWWEKNAEDVNFPLIMVDVFETVKESRSRIARVGAWRRHEISKPSKPITYEADLQFAVPQASSPVNLHRIQGTIALKPSWNYTELDIALHKLEFRAAGKMILVFDNQGDDVILRVVVKRNTQPDLDDFWGAQIIPRFEERSLTELQQRSIYLEFENGTEESVFFYVGLLPHQVTIRSLLHEIDPPIADALLYKKSPPKANRMKVKDHITYSFKAYDAQCLRWNSVKRKWSNHCKVSENDLTETTVSCHCHGLSTIGASFRAANVFRASPSTFALFIKLMDNSLIFWFLIYLTLFFLGLFAWGGMWDRHKKKHDKLIFLNDNDEGDTYRYVIVVQTGRNLGSITSSKIAVMLEGSESKSSVHVLHSLTRRVMLEGSRDYFVLCTPRSLGDVFCIHMWHDDEGRKPIWYIDKIIVHDVQTQQVSLFIYETWLSPFREGDRGALSCYRMLNSEILRWNMRLRDSFVDVMSVGYHCWLGMCARQLPRNNTKRRRVVLAFVHACVLMAFVTTFYPFYVHGTVTKQLGRTEEFIFEWEEVVVGILAATMAFPVNCVIFYVARNVAPVQSYTTVYSSRYVEELVIPMPANPAITAPQISSDKKLSPVEKVKISALYKPGEKQVIGKRTMPLGLPQTRVQKIFYEEVISRMGPIKAEQRIRLAYVFPHIFLYPLWALLGIVLLMAFYFILFYATRYTWSTGLRYLFATFIGFLFSFLILEPSKVIVLAFWKMRIMKGNLVIDDRSYTATYIARYSDEIHTGKNRSAAIYKIPSTNDPALEEKQKNL